MRRRGKPAAGGGIALSGYRIVWLIVLFDLPVGTGAQRSAAARFRNHLLDHGFEMAQYSVYMRHCSGKEQAVSVAGRIADAIPSAGRVHMIRITDKQYENIQIFYGKERELLRRNPDQLVMF